MNAAVSERVIAAMRAASALLSKHGVRHALVGGLAVGAWGWPRATSDVDFMIGREWLSPGAVGASPRLSGEIVFLLSDVERDTGVGVDAFVVAKAPAGSKASFPAAVERALRRVVLRDGVPVAPPEVVVATKLLRGEARDDADVVQLLRVKTIDRARVRRFLVAHVSALQVKRFDAFVRRARAEAEAAKKSERVLRPARRG
jgi:hypothetical protein